MVVKSCAHLVSCFHDVDQAAYKYLVAAENINHCQERVDGKVVRKWLSVCAHSLARAQHPLKAAAIFEELGDLQKSKQIYIAVKAFGGLSLCSTTQYRTSGAMVFRITKYVAFHRQSSSYF